MAKSTYTYEWQFRAVLGADYVIVPDQIAGNLIKHDDERTVFTTQCGKRVRLNGKNNVGAAVLARVATRKK